ncbi:MAG: peptidoglycan-binding protein [Lentilitoribacter sp.]
MSGFPTDRFALLNYRDELETKKQAAVAAGNNNDAGRLEKEINLVQMTLSKLAMEGLANLAGDLGKLRAELEALRSIALEWPFGDQEAPIDHERSFRSDTLPDNDFEDEGPDKPAPAPKPVPIEKVPKVSEGWSQNYNQLWKNMTISDDWSKKSERICEKIIANQARYAAAVQGTKVPWWFIAVLHSMECSLRFDQHLHNGDPLIGRTKQVPKGRPPASSPPFTWEESARDALEYDRLLRVEDWSLASVMYHWHRYNGINNAYKRNGIPTPYLWSGSQHYRKGKYVADGKFDANAISLQVGAAVLLKALDELGVVKIKGQDPIVGTAETASGSRSTINLPLPGAAFKHIKSELGFHGTLKIGDGGTGTSRTEKDKVRKVQEWLVIAGLHTSIDGDYGHSTEKQIRRFQELNGRAATGILDEETWVRLSNPIRRALAPIDHGASASFEQAILNVARQHIAQKPEEVGGNNKGPWTRLYMEGKQGSAQKWCAGFVCFTVAQAMRDLDERLPFKRQVGVDQLVEDAKSTGRFIRGSDLTTPAKRRSVLREGMLFVVRRTSTDWTHVGIVANINDDDFDTLEGNTDNAGGVDGANAKVGNRAYKRKDFIRLI